MLSFFRPETTVESLMEGTSIAMKVFLIRKDFAAVYLTNERLCSYNQLLTDVFHSNGFTKPGFYLKVVLKCLLGACMSVMDVCIA